jgi:hypothetical protein
VRFLYLGDEKLVAVLKVHALEGVIKKNMEGWIKNPP